MAATCSRQTIDQTDLAKVSVLFLVCKGTKEMCSSLIIILGAFSKFGIITRQKV